MDRRTLLELLEAVHRGDASVSHAMATLVDFPSAELADATLDTHRAVRCGFPEVVLAQGKSDDQLARITERLLATGENVLLTRIEAPRAEALVRLYAGRGGDVVGGARLCVFRQKPVELRGRGTIAVVSAGTSDTPVAEEAAVTAELMGNAVARVHDVGVAGVHRLLRQLPTLREARVIVVVAGMEGALPSVVGGLVDKPVIAVPTSVGYGASFGGLAALLGMLNSCAAGITVVNIDNGFGAGYAAALMNRRDDL